MSDKRIIFENVDGSLAIVIPVAPAREGELETLWLNRIAAESKPQGATQKAIIDKSELPYADSGNTTVIEDYVLDKDTGLVSKAPVKDKIRAFRGSWRWSGGAIVVDSTLEIAERWARIRVIRNKLLALSDGTMARENEQGGPNQAAMKAYRQSLRNVPNDHTNPNDITWPEAP